MCSYTKGTYSLASLKKNAFLSTTSLILLASIVRFIYLNCVLILTSNVLIVHKFLNTSKQPGCSFKRPFTNPMTEITLSIFTTFILYFMITKSPTLMTWRTPSFLKVKDTAFFTLFRCVFIIDNVIGAKLLKNLCFYKRRYRSDYSCASGFRKL